MENFLFAFNAIAPLFFLIVFGYLLKKKNVINQNFMETANNFVFRYLFPVNTFRQIYKVDITANVNPVFIVYGIFICILMGVMLWVIAPRFIKDKQTCSAYIQGSYRSNCVLMGVALSAKVFGDTGSLPTIMLLPFASIVFNTIAVIILTTMSPDNRTVSFKRVLIDVLKNPIIIGALSGVVVSLIGFKFPPFISTVIDDLSSMVTPLALICLGGQMEINNLFDKPGLILTGSLNKLILSPLMAIIPAILFFDFTSYEIGALFFIFGSSTAVSSFIMAKAMKSDTTLAGQLLMYTTLFSSITMFGWIYILRSMQII